MIHQLLDSHFPLFPLCSISAAFQYLMSKSNLDWILIYFRVRRAEVPKSTFLNEKLLFALRSENPFSQFI
jgi:hypothetical protein